MEYILAYLIIGLVFAGLTGGKAILDAEEEGGPLAVLVTFVLIAIIGALLWPMLLTGRVCKFFTKPKGER
ncbi:hypothetical protein [Aneurinibacillus aneurinilyticus]|jgi:tellurite resistance protein TehA-like permease|uniref:Uncharacterized protein n=1 Tax=Aneurinibacillus aneurinilyticus TaxID=1391 RepID=A0A848CRD9_ANEAE|nr:hypothetical protein [Aneurinibacillus aneurinilyticus]NMF00025.1 hypothetical protein [Aneurinibacillus aneurinilyticus]